MRLPCQLDDLGRSFILTCTNCDLCVELKGRVDNPVDVQAACQILKQRCPDCRELAVEYVFTEDAENDGAPVSSVEL